MIIMSTCNGGLSWQQACGTKTETLLPKFKIDNETLFAIW